MESLLADFRFGARTLWKSRGFTIVAIVTLALGVGASSAIFSVIDNVLLEPFPYQAAQRLVSIEIHDTDDSSPGGRASYSGAEFLDYAGQNHVLEGAIGDAGEDVLYASGEGTERFAGQLTTPGTFEFFGVPAFLGRVAQADWHWELKAGMFRSW